MQVSPWLLREHDVTVKACVQYPGEFVLTVPQAYHCGFSYGFNCGEAVNFAPVEWLADGSDAARTYRLTNRPPPFSHARLVLTVAARAAAAEMFSYSLGVKRDQPSIADKFSSFRLLGFRSSF